MREKLELKIVVIVFVLLIAGVLVAVMSSVKLERDDMYSVSQERLVDMAHIVSASIKRSMVEANADFTRSLLDDLKNVGAFDLKLYNNQFREALMFQPDSEPEKDVHLEEIMASGNEKVFLDGRILKAYIPLNNLPKCQQCHSGEGKVIGAVKVSVSMEEEYSKIVRFGMIMGFGSILAVLLIGTVLWQSLRMSIISPLKALEGASLKMSEGDLSFNTNIRSHDEIGRLDRSIKESLYSLSAILRRVRDVTVRISDTTDMVGNETDKIVDGTMLEAEAIAEISSSIEELNAAITEVADSTTNMTSSIQDTAASMEEMANTISSIKEITHEVSGGVDTTSSSIHQLSANIKEVADNAADLGRVSDETLSATEEIATSFRAVEARAKESSALSLKVAEDASTLGVTAINETKEGMERIMASVSKAANAVETLGGRSDEIGNILTVIDDIADQTTLLALNASILAAQAGEHGKGFSVIANEIKDLAERTALSTHEIDSLIRSVREEVSTAVKAMSDGTTAVEEGMKLSKKTSYALDSILKSSRQSSEMSSSIERTTSEQTRTAKYVTEAIEKVRGMVVEIVNATQEQSKGVNLIMKASEDIREASHRADSATEQQAEGSRQISMSVEHISEMSLQISRAINEQKSGSRQIWTSIEKIKDIPSKNRDLAFKANKALKELSSDSDLAKMEMERFVLYEGDRSGTIKFGIVPYDAPAKLFARFTPMVQHLSKQLGKRVEISVAQDYSTAMRDMEQGNTQICFMTSLTYVLVHEKHNIEPLAKALRSGKPLHRSVIFTREHSTVKTFEDIRNRTMAFVDKSSASGYIVPHAMLKKAGLEISDLSFHQFIGYHDDVVKSVLAGDFDVGAVMESALSNYEEEGIRIIGSSDEIPEFVICAGETLSDEEKAIAMDTLLQLNEENPLTKTVVGAIDPDYTGLVDTTDDDYEIIRKYKEKVG